MKTNYSSIFDIVPKKEVEYIFSDSLEKNSKIYNSANKLYNGDIYYIEKNNNGNDMYWQKSNNQKRLLFQVSELTNAFYEFSVHETFVYSHDSIYILFSTSGNEECSIAHIYFTVDGIRMIETSHIIFRRVFIRGNSSSCVYLVGETETGLAVYKLNLNSTCKIYLKLLPITVEGKYSSISLSWDYPTDSLQVITRNFKENKSYIIKNDDDIIFFACNIASECLLVPYGIKIGDEYKFILHIMNFKNQESFVYICDSSTHSYWESKARLLFKGVMIDFVILNGTVTLIERQKSEILLKLFLLKSNSDSQYVESYTRVLGSCKTDWRIKCDYKNSDSRLILCSASNKYYITLEDGVINLNSILSYDISNTSDIFSGLNIHEVSFDDEGIIGKLSIISKHDFKDIKYAHITGYNFYGISQNLVEAPQELKSILDLGKIAFCLVNFKDDKYSSYAKNISGPKKILIKQKIFRKALQETVKFLGLNYHSVSIEGRSAGAILAAPLLKTESDYVKVALFSKPLLDPYTTFLKEQNQGAVSRAYEWGDIYNPKDIKDIFRYSPMCNLPIKSSSAVLITADKADRRIPYSSVEEYASRLKASGSHVLVANVGGGHLALGNPYLRMLEFLAEYVWVHQVMSLEK